LEDTRVVYVNTFAEGACTTNPQVLTEENVEAVARAWRRSETVIHVKLLGMETVRFGDERKTVLFGDLGAAKLVLPVDKADLEETQNPMDLLDHWVSVVIDGHDFAGGGMGYIYADRAKALQILRNINGNRVNVGQQAYGVVQKVRRGAYIMNVGGFTAILPKAFYDWDALESKKFPEVGDEFPVQVIPSKVENRIVVSRRDLLPNPYEPSALPIARGALVKARTAFLRGGLLKADVSMGLRVSVNLTNMREIPEPGAVITVRVLGRNKIGYYGMFV